MEKEHFIAPEVPEGPTAGIAEHPCYSLDACHQFARMHLPVAPHCNIQCNYCNRRYDCANESRPGVTSEILTPKAARDKFVRVKRELANLTVVGIAGPGDALANWSQVKETITLIQKEASDCLVCLSTNGLMLPEYEAEILSLGIRHVTVTVNCIDPMIGAMIYHHLDYQGRHYTGKSGVEILIENQMEGIRYLATRGVLVKINIVMIPGINDVHIPFVVKKVKELGAFITNIMPLIPVAGSAFESLPKVRIKDLQTLRQICQADIRQMCHCGQCRADAIGMIHQDRTCEFRETQSGAV